MDSPGHSQSESLLSTPRPLDPVDAACRLFDRAVAAHDRGRLARTIRLCRQALRRCPAVIQHGGIGTTAQALRCGRPMLVEPYGNDQHFNAGRIAALGVGAAVDHRLLTSENLADALARFVLTGEARAAAGELGRAIDAEHGLTRACDLIEAELAA
jgi:UDP:flavonoid glycosyltransferase YjiC (YdhE family)